MSNTKIKFETISLEDNVEKFNILNYQLNMNKQANYIQTKIEGAEIKITSLKTKEKIIDDMIRRSNILVEKYNNESNLKLAGINSSHILVQFETLSQVQEMLIKYEDMIQRYVKMIVDIENHKINAFTKINAVKKEEDKNETGYNKLMVAMHDMLQNKESDSISSPGGPSHPALLDNVKEQLKLEGY